MKIATKVIIKISVMIFATQVALQPASAGKITVKKLQGNLANMWQSIGSSVHNEPYHYQGQRAGHYSMGSSYLMREVRNRSFFSLNAPDIDLGAKRCFQSSILNFGAFSHLNTKELKDKLTAITTNAGLTMAYLGLSAISPVVSESVQETFSKLQELGGFLNDDCNTGMGLGVAAGDIASAYSERIKTSVGKFRTETGYHDDYIAFLRKWPNGRNAAVKKLAEKSEKMRIEDVNIAWEAIGKLNVKDVEIKKLMMTISGTVIIKAPKTDSGTPDIKAIPSEVTNPMALGTLLKGGASMKILKCKGGGKNTKCLQVEREDQKILIADSFQAKVEKYFDSFEKALKNDEELEDPAQNFLNKSGIPAYRVFDVLFRYTSGNPQFEQGQLVQIVAWQILYNYISDMLRDVTDATNDLQIASTKELTDFKESLQKAKKYLTELESKNLQKESLKLNLIKRSEFFEQTMANETTKIFSMMRG